MPKSTVELNRIVDMLNKNPRLKISVQGHTDNVGTTEYNKALSENRARVVYEYLIANGISADRLSYIGFGKTKAVADNSTEEGRSQNRRTEFVVTEK
jgi:outer membrane protein OmpA-like peptidoglycan-associated protein